MGPSKPFIGKAPLAIFGDSVDAAVAILNRLSICLLYLSILGPRGARPLFLRNFRVKHVLALHWHEQIRLAHEASGSQHMV